MNYVFLAFKLDSANIVNLEIKIHYKDLTGIR